jgi:histidinol-phosphate aminotransferase
MTVPRYRWQPTTAEIAAAAGIAEADVERFDHNTSPTPTSWAASVVAGASSRLNEYPAASYQPLRRAVAEARGTTVERVIPGAGADELILLVGRAFLRAASTALTVAPTYPLYAISTAQAGATLRTIQADPPDFAFPADEVVAAAPDADVVWLCVPNNPTGSRPAPEALEAIVDAARGIVVVDAAYAEFAGDEWASWAADHDNVLVLQTLSKAYGLAGARVGYGLGHRDLVDALDGVRPPGSIASLSVELGIAALGHPARMRATVADLARSRVDLARSLSGLGFRVLASPSNFLLCEVGPDAPGLHASLMEEGLVVRGYPADGPLRQYLRFTVRTPGAHRRLVDAIERIRK